VDALLSLGGRRVARETHVLVVVELPRPRLAALLAVGVVVLLSFLHAGGARGVDEAVDGAAVGRPEESRGVLALVQADLLALHGAGHVLDAGIPELAREHAGGLARERAEGRRVEHVREHRYDVALAGPRVAREGERGFRARAAVEPGRDGVV